MIYIIYVLLETFTISLLLEDVNYC